MAIKLGTTGNDTVTGSAGWDTLYGLSGNDLLLGGIGADMLSGGDGNDTLEGGVGADTLHGGAGADIFKYTSYSHANGDEIVDFSAADSLNFSAIAGGKFIGNAQFTGISGEIRYYYGGYSNYSPYIAIDSDGNAEGDVFLAFAPTFGKDTKNFTETSIGSRIFKLATNRSLTGTNATESLTGGAGNDTLSGLLGNDTLSGGEGDDVLLGGDGNDVLQGGLGANVFTGGNGADTFRFITPDELPLPNGTAYPAYKLRRVHKR